MFPYHFSIIWKGKQTIKEFVQRRRKPKKLFLFRWMNLITFLSWVPRRSEREVVETVDISTILIYNILQSEFNIETKFTRPVLHLRLAEQEQCHK